MTMTGKTRRHTKGFQVYVFLITLGLCFIVAHELRAQIRLNDWQTYSSLSNIRQMAQDNAGVLWGASSGGVFGYDPITRISSEFRNINALLGIDISAIGVHPQTGDIYAGGVNGMLNIRNKQQWSNIPDIFSSNLISKRINSFAFRDSLVFIGGEFGLTVFDATRKVFLETVVRLGNLQPGVAVKQVLTAQNRLWVCTPVGLVSAPLSSARFIDPSVWTVHTTNTAFVRSIAIAEHQGSMYVAAGDTLLRMSTNGLQKVGQGDAAIRSIISTGTSLYYSTEYSLYGLAGGAITNTYPAFINALARADSAGAARLTVCTTQGFATLANNKLHFTQFNGPLFNRFRQLSVDPTGALWCANSSGSGNASIINESGPALGFSRLLKGGWKNFTSDVYPAMKSNGYYTIYAAADTSIWAGGWGSGVIRVKMLADSTFSVSRYDSANSRLRGGSGGSFVVIGTVRTDARNTVWMTQYSVDSLAARDSSGRFYIFGPPAGICDLRNYSILTVDPSGVKWIGSSHETGGGLWAFNDRGTLQNSADSWRCVSELSSSLVHTAITPDKNGELWIGTKSGLYHIVNPYDVFSPTNSLRVRLVQSQTPLETIINDIFVDAQNNKWVATNLGVFVLNESGDSALTHITTNNSPLASNAVFSIAIDGTTGRAYFGTDNGLSSAQTLSVPASASFGLRCYPQPFVPQQDPELVVDGLAGNATVKVSTLDGILIRSIPANNSRTVVWDGRNRQGQLVESGVYIISAYSATIGSSAAIKAIVIHK